MVRNLDPTCVSDTAFSLSAILFSSYRRKLILTQLQRKAICVVVSFLNLNRWVMDRLYPPERSSPDGNPEKNDSGIGPNLNYYDVQDYPNVEGYVAFTVDDAFCGHDDEDFCRDYQCDKQPQVSQTGKPDLAVKRSMVKEIGELCKEFDVRGTFFATSAFCENGQQDDIHEFLQIGEHELGNHMPRDMPYDDFSEADFERELLRCNKFLEERVIQNPEENDRIEDRIRWFRAPNGCLSSGMQRVLQKHNMKSAMLDCYAYDTDITDADFIASTVLRNIQSGSIWLIHMPERGFREWNLFAMRKVMEGLRKRGLKSVTLTELEKRAKGGCVT